MNSLTTYFKRRQALNSFADKYLMPRQLPAPIEVAGPAPTFPAQQPIVQSPPINPVQPQTPQPSQVVSPNPPVQIPVNDQEAMNKSLEDMATALPTPESEPLTEAKRNLIREVSK